MSDLDRLLKLSGQKAQSQTQKTAERELKAVATEDEARPYQGTAEPRLTHRGEKYYDHPSTKNVPTGEPGSKAKTYSGRGGNYGHGINPDAGDPYADPDYVEVGSKAKTYSGRSGNAGHGVNPDAGDPYAEPVFRDAIMRIADKMARQKNIDALSKNYDDRIQRMSRVESVEEAVGEFAEPIYDLIDMHFEGDCQPVFDDLVRFLSGDQIKEFVADFRRHHDLPSMDEIDADTEESVEPTEPSTEEGNKFSGELAKAKEDGKDEFEVDGEKYKVKKEEFTNENDLEEIEEATGKCEDCGCIIDEPTPGCDCPHDVHDASQDNWVKEANRLRELSGMSSIEEETPVDEDKSRKPYPGEYDYTDEKYMDADGTPKSDDKDDDKKKSKESVKEADKTIPVNKSVPLAMDSIWDEDKENPKQVMVKSITVENPYEPGGFLDDDEDDGYRQVNVEHDGPWHIYTDSGFEKAISGMVGFNVDFTEQGMQQDGMASMEGNMEVDVKSEAFAGYKPNRFKDMPKGMNEGRKPFPGEYDYTDEKYMDADGTPKSDKKEKKEKKEETIEEAPTMDTTQLITLLKNAGLTEEQIKQRVDEWANTPAVGASEDKETSHGEPYENFAQSVNLSLKRYLDAEDFKVQGLKEHKVEDIKEAYKKSKESKKKEDKKD